MLRILALLLLPLATAFAEQYPFEPIRQQEWPLWAQAFWPQQSQQRIPVYLHIENRSRLETDNHLLRNANGLDDIETGAVPLAYLDWWLEQTLDQTGLFVRSSNPDERYRIDIMLIEYQPLYTAEGEAGFWRDRESTFNRWYEDWQPGLRTQVGFNVQWHDRQRAEHRQFSSFLEARPCERFRGAASLPDGHHPAFAEHYRRSLVGQTTTALMNRVVYWLQRQHPEREQFHPVETLRDGRVEWRIAEPTQKVGEIVEVFHREDPERLLGSAQITRVQQQRVQAYPLTLTPGSVAVGDLIKTYQPRIALPVFPARIIERNSCPAEEPQIEQESEVSEPIEPLAVLP